MTFTVTRLIGLEALEVVWVDLCWAASRQRLIVAMPRIECVVYMAVKAGRTVKPGTCADEHSTVEPLCSVIAVRRAVVRSVIVIAVRTTWFYANADGDLGLRLCCGDKEKNCGEQDEHELAHVVPQRMRVRRGLRSCAGLGLNTIRDEKHPAPGWTRGARARSR